MTPNDTELSGHPRTFLTSASENGVDVRRMLQRLVDRGDGSREEATLLRVTLLRHDHPDARIESDVLPREGDGPIVVTKIVLPTGASATGIAEHDDLTVAEHRALSRALDLLGHTLLLPDLSSASTAPIDLSSASSDVPEFGLESRGTTPSRPALPAYVEDDDVLPPGIPATPQTRSTPPIRSTPAVDTDSYAETQPQADDVARHPMQPPSPPSVIDAVRRANLRRHVPGPDSGSNADDSPAPQIATPPSRNLPPTQLPSRDTRDEPPLEDYSWTAFWRVARQQGLDKAKVEGLIGRTIEGMTPMQVRESLANVDVHIGS